MNPGFVPGHFWKIPWKHELQMLYIMVQFFKKVVKLNTMVKLMAC